MKKNKFKKISKRMIVLEHYYNPLGIGDWYVVEKNKMGKDVILVCLVFFRAAPKIRRLSRKQLLAKELPFRAKIVRDMNFKRTSVGELLEKLGF